MTQDEGPSAARGTTAAAGGRVIVGGTLPSAAGLPGPPLMYWYVSTHDGDATGAEKALLAGLRRYIDDTMRKVKVAASALGLDKKQDDVHRLAFYLNKPATYADAVDNQARIVQQNAIAQQTGQPQRPLPPIYSWETQRAYFPWDFEQDWNDFQDLRQRAAKGEFRDAM